MTQAFNQAPRSDGLLEGRGNSCWTTRCRPPQPAGEPGLCVPLACPHHGYARLARWHGSCADRHADPGVHGRPGRCGVVKLAQDDNWLTVELSSGLLFNSGSAFLGNNAAPVLDTLSGILKPVDNYVRVRGYTDNQPINNEIFRSNWTLSAARAEAVLNALVGKGVAPGRLAYEAYGEFSPSSTMAPSRDDYRIARWWSPYPGSPGCRQPRQTADGGTGAGRTAECRQ